MRKLMARFSALVFVASVLSSTPAFAADDWPAPPTPSWLASSGIAGVRVGQWLPCKVEWHSTNDCIASITWSKLDGTKSGASVFQPRDGFDPMTAKQIWDTAKDLQGNTVDNYAHFDGAIAGMWQYPDGFTNSDGSKTFYVEAHLMNGGLQFRVISGNNTNLPTDASAEITLQSANYAKYGGWVFSNTKNPGINVDSGVIKISGTPVLTPINGVDSNSCHSNSSKAITSMAIIQINWTSAGYGNGTVKAGDAILGTNGVGCFTGVSFDPASQQLVVGVGNSHFDENGTTVQGWFDLQLKGDRARQWWGVSPEVGVNSVKVEVVYEDGTSVIASTTASYDAKTDLISLKSRGFHFSSPSLRVSFKSAASTASGASASSTSGASATKATSKTTITCIKGKLTKSISGVKPTCPTGYKKK